MSTVMDGSGLRGLVGAVNERRRALHLGGIAAAAAFWLTISVFPAGLAMTNVLGLVTGQQRAAEFIGRFARGAPGSLGDWMADQLILVAAPTPGSGLRDTGMVLLAVWSVSTAMNAMLRGIRQIHGLDRSPFLIGRVAALAVTTLGLLVIGAVAAVVDATSHVASIVGSAVALVAMAVLIAVAFRAAVGKSLRWTDHLPGAGLAALALLVIFVGLSLYGDISANFESVYGTSAGGVLSMLGLWLAAYAVLIGACVNAVRAEPAGNADGRSGPRQGSGPAAD